MITYTSPVAGEDSIIYQICDPSPLCSTATIYIFVDTTTTPFVHGPPVAVNDFDSTNYGVPVVVNVLGNDYDNYGDAFTTKLIYCEPAFGTASIDPNGDVTYTPGPLAVSSDTFCYQICDISYSISYQGRLNLLTTPSIYAVLILLTNQCLRVYRNNRVLC
jgi:hypothetical protein